MLVRTEWSKRAFFIVSAYLWVQIRMEQHVSVWIYGKVVAVWAKLEEKGKRRVEEDYNAGE